MFEDLNVCARQLQALHCLRNCSSNVQAKKNIDPKKNARPSKVSQKFTRKQIEHDAVTKRRHFQIVLYKNK
jgi:hypothetical protein